MSRRASERSTRSRKRNSSGRKLTKSERDHRSRQLNPKDRLYHLSRLSTPSEKTWIILMEEVAASRIQSNADKTGKNQDFKARAQSAANRNKN